MSEPEQLRVLRIKEFSAAYGICVTRVYEEINAGRLKAMKIGHSTVIKVSDAEAWLAALPAYRPRKSARAAAPLTVAL